MGYDYPGPTYKLVPEEMPTAFLYDPYETALCLPLTSFEHDACKPE